MVGNGQERSRFWAECAGCKVQEDPEGSAQAVSPGLSLRLLHSHRLRSLLSSLHTKPYKLQPFLLHSTNSLSTYHFRPSPSYSSSCNKHTRFTLEILNFTNQSNKLRLSSTCAQQSKFLDTPPSILYTSTCAISCKTATLLPLSYARHLPHLTSTPLSTGLGHSCPVHYMCLLQLDE
jgi:hypothetical protein